MVRRERRAVALISIDGLPAAVLDDPAIHLPHLRALAARGVRATALRPVFPTVTWPCHTTLVTGVSPARHGVLGNHVLDRRSGVLVSHYGDRSKAPVRVETLWDRAAAAGLRSAAVCWPKTRSAKNLADCVPEFFDQELFEAHSTRPLWTELRHAGLPVDRYAAWSEAFELAALQDWLSLEAATWLVRRRPPDLLLLHFLLPDCFQHDHGPGSPEARWALEHVDGLLGRFLDALERAGRADLTDVVVVGDHGLLGSRAVSSPNAVLPEAGMVPGGASGWRGEREARVVSNGGSAHVYVAPGPDREARVGRLRDVLARAPGVAAVLGPDAYPDLGLPALSQDPTQGELILVAADDWYFDDRATPDEGAPVRYRGSHGHLPTDPRMMAGFVAAGPGIPEGRRIAEASQLDIAPTVAALLGLTLPAAERPPLWIPATP
jgi:predicted AlkP superfamily pyrophosphatase or phosphodiesterase